MNFIKYKIGLINTGSLIILLIIFTQFIIKSSYNQNKPYFLTEARASENKRKEVDYALYITLKPEAKVSSGELTLGDICIIKTMPGFKINTEKIKAIKSGFTPASGLRRLVEKFEIDNLLKQKLVFPQNCSYILDGAKFCTVTTTDEINNFNKNTYNDFKLKLENTISKLFLERYGEKFKIRKDAIIKTIITYGLNSNNLTIINSCNEIKIEIENYKYGLAQISANFKPQKKIKLYASIKIKAIAAAANEKLLKGERIDLNKIKSSEIEIIAEKYHELFLINDKKNELINTANSELEFTKNIAAEEFIKKNYLKKKIIVKAGQLINLYIKKKKSALSFNVTAATNGSEGDVIEVINPKTRKKYNAVIINNETVEAVEVNK